MRDMLREYRAEQARVVREIKAQWQLSRTNQLVAAMADKLVKAERVRQAEPLPVRALDVDYLRYTAAGNEVACTADSNAQARSMRHQWRQEGRAVVEREHASKTAQRINIAEMAARRRTMAQTWRQDEKIIAEAKRGASRSPDIP